MIDLHGGGKRTALAELDTRTALATPLLDTAFDAAVDRDQFCSPVRPTTRSAGRCWPDEVPNATVAGPTPQARPKTR